MVEDWKVDWVSGKTGKPMGGMGAVVLVPRETRDS